MTNPLLSYQELPPFPAIQAEHVDAAVDTVIKECEQALPELEALEAPNWETFMEPLDRLSKRIHMVWGPIGHLLATCNNDEMRQAHERNQPRMIELMLRFSQSPKLFAGYRKIRESAQWEQLAVAQQRIVEASLRDAKLSGIDLTGEAKERFNANAKELSRLSTQFSNNVLDADKAFSLTLTEKEDIAGLPQSLLELASQLHNDAMNTTEEKTSTPTEGPWRITLAIPVYMPFQKHAKQRHLREQLYLAYIQRATQDSYNNQPLIDSILTLRQEQAKLLGFSSFAQVSLEKKMADSVADVDKLLEELREASWAPAQKELLEVKTWAEKQGFNDEMQPWDFSYWSERLRENMFSFTDEELKPYFPLPKVLDGLFALVKKLFAIDVVAADGDAEVWHPDVRYFKIFDSQKKLIAGFFLDPYSRPATKRGGAWMNDCRGLNKAEYPVAYLVCNSSPPVGKAPSLLTFREVETVFHEFGHGLQHMLTRVPFPQAAGINGVEWDAVELPSQFMENWCYHKPTVKKISGHYESGEPLPDELFDKLEKARTFLAANFMLRQLRFAMTDMELHHRFSPGEQRSVFDVATEFGERTSIIASHPSDKSLCAFSHIFAGGYAAGYYSYKWAEVLSADAFGAFEEVGLDDDAAIAAVGGAFRDTVLALGGGEHPSEVFKQFRGRAPTTEALLRHSGLS